MSWPTTWWTLPNRWAAETPRRCPDHEESVADALVVALGVIVGDELGEQVNPRFTAITDGTTARTRLVWLRQEATSPGETLRPDSRGESAVDDVPSGGVVRAFAVSRADGKLE